MESIKVLGKMTVKQVVTEGYKLKVGQQVQAEINKMTEDIAAYEKEMNKTITELTLKAHPQVDQVRRQLNAEKEKLVIYKEQLQMSLQEIADMPEGNLVETGEGNFIQELKVGDHFPTNTNCEVILKDDIIIEINR